MMRKKRLRRVEIPNKKEAVSIIEDKVSNNSKTDPGDISKMKARLVRESP